MCVSVIFSVCMDARVFEYINYILFVSTHPQIEKNSSTGCVNLSESRACVFFLFVCLFCLVRTNIGKTIFYSTSLHRTAARIMIIIKAIHARHHAHGRVGIEIHLVCLMRLVRLMHLMRLMRLMRLMSLHFSMLFG